ncbi:ketoacyl-ACP synthase III [Myxococcota bacterium]|nr:ketoacyl-ACP synthase III [Myxococcota bacterium]
MRSAVLRSTGFYVPEREITNAEFHERIKHVAPEFVSKMEKSGILTRREAPADWATSDLAVRAAQDALTRAGLGPEAVDLIVLGTDSPDYITPATSVVVQHKLGAKNAGTFDVGCACASFPTAISAAAGIIATNPAIKTVLVIGVYMMHKLAAKDDPVSFFYGDGAGAAVLEAGTAPGFLGASYRADGSYAPKWAILAGGTVEPATEAAVKEGRTQVRMYDRYPPEVNEEGWPEVARKLARDAGFALSDVDLFVFTQVRRPTIELVMQKLGVPLEKTHMIMDRYGYTGSACIPMALHDAILKGKAKPGQLVVLVGSGVGYNQAGAALRLTDRLVTA